MPGIVAVTINPVDRGSGKGPRYDAMVEFDFSVTDGATTVQEHWYGMGSDYSVPDKALYKAITSGHKYYLAKLLCVGAGNEDAEHEEEERKPHARAVAQSSTSEKVPVERTEKTSEAVNSQEGTMNDLMPIELASQAKTTDGKLYSEIDSGTLAHMATTIKGKIAKGGYKPEELEQYKFKLAAILAILASRK